MSYDGDPGYEPDWQSQDGRNDHVPVAPGMAQIGLDLIAAIEHLARSIDRLASGPPASTGGYTSMGGPTGPPVGQMPPAAAQPPGPGGPNLEGMGKKVFAICRTQGWDIPTVGGQITGHPMAANSQKWSEADLKQVLAQFAAWGHP